VTQFDMPNGVIKMKYEEMKNVLPWNTMTKQSNGESDSGFKKGPNENLCIIQTTAIARWAKRDDLLLVEFDGFDGLFFPFRFLLHGFFHPIRASDSDKPVGSNFWSARNGSAIIEYFVG
jgi:hypothetical protein